MTGRLDHHLSTWISLGAVGVTGGLTPAAALAPGNIVGGIAGESITGTGLFNVRCLPYELGASLQTALPSASDPEALDESSLPSSSGGEITYGEIEAIVRRVLKELGHEVEHGREVVVSAGGYGLDAPIRAIFGRCPAFVFVNTDTMECKGVPNPAVTIPTQAGVKAAQFVVSRGVQAVLTGNVGTNAFKVLQEAGIPVHSVTGVLSTDGTVREAVEAYTTGRLPVVTR